VLLEGQQPTDDAAQFLQTMFRNLLTPGPNTTPA
jgi:TetR/AcrR family transcriptional regulator